MTTSSPTLTSPTTVRGVTADTVPAWWPIARFGVAVQHLSRDRCRELLATHETGRLFLPGRRAHSTAIRYRIGSDVLVIVPPPAVLDALASRPPLVMVCVDHLEDDQQHGWSLAVAGSLVPPADQWRDQPALDPGALLLDLHSLTGRSVSATSASTRPVALLR
ncbi:hypothetical protein [uncultured Friedmanniella sp.]|uniref:hypothetical protein n=1 Tax=uncultured Friedmanniella sp. TaxID=335381 RepID=UPI0035CBF0AE